MAHAMSVFNRAQQSVSVPDPEASPVRILPLSYRPMLGGLVFIEVLWTARTQWLPQSFAQRYQIISS